MFKIINIYMLCVKKYTLYYFSVLWDLYVKKHGFV